MMITFERNFRRALSKYQTGHTESCFDLHFRKKFTNYMSIQLNFKGHSWILSPLPVHLFFLMDPGPATKLL